MSLVVVETLFDRIVGEIARGRLEAAGIEAVLFDGGIASVIGSGLSGVRLMVDEADERAARALLDDLEAASAVAADHSTAAVAADHSTAAVAADHSTAAVAADPDFSAP